MSKRIRPCRVVTESLNGNDPMKLAIATILGMLALGAGPASAITVDGSLDASYGAATANVTNPGFLPYSIYLKAENGGVYGFLQASGPSGLPFTNLYFDQ